LKKEITINDYEEQNNYNMFNNKLIISLAIVALVLHGCHSGEQNNVESIVGVKVQAVKEVHDTVQNYYVGVVEESIAIPLSFLTSGTIEQVRADEGTPIKKGQLLASLNSENYRNALQMTAAKEKQAKDAYERLSEVYKNGSLPEVKMVEIETSLEQAKATVQIAAKNLADCNLYSPASGIIGKRSIEPGMNVIPGVTVLTIVKIDKVFIRVSIPENEIISTNIGQEALIRVPALKDKTFHGLIEQKGVMANPLSHTYDIKIAIQNPEEILRPGMVCNVIIKGSPQQKGISIPQQSVQVDEVGKKYVFTVDSATNRAVRKIIETNELCGNGNITVTKGLHEGDLLVMEGYQKISINTPVQIIR
jgi:membrane fusion protein (multidrug efflux system)